MPKQPQAIRQCDGANLDGVEVALKPRIRKRRRCPFRLDRREFISKPVAIERAQVFSKSCRQFLQRNRLDLGGTRIERHMIPEYRADVCRRWKIASVRLSKLGKASKDFVVLTAISDALHFSGPHGPKHAVEFLLRRRLTFDEAMVVSIVRE